ncbi:MAG: glycosyltransferase [Phycisphaerales bacterium]|nr:glycosyltransferase [Phycisphaerales bacterium]
MRIFHAAADSPNYWDLPQSRLWYGNLYLPLLDLGHELIRFEYDFGMHNNHLNPANPIQREFMLRHRPMLGDQLLNQIRAAHRHKPIDLLFTYFYSAYVDPEVIREIRRMGIVTVNWYCNGSYQFDLVSEIAPAYDFCLVPEKFRLEDYRAVGANPIYCQEAANPNIYRPYDLPVEFDVTFVGQRYGNRPDYVKHLIANDVPVRVWGPRWTDPPKRSGTLDAELAACAGGALEDEQLIRMYSRSRISLGFSAVAKLPKDGSPPIKQVRLRDFEAPMSGAFYLVEHFDELTEFFEPDREMVTFGSADELAEKCRYYLAHPRQRETIRQAGMVRARSEHTWQRRFERAFEQMGLKPACRRSA